MEGGRRGVWKGEKGKRGRGNKGGEGERRVKDEERG